MIWNYKLFFVCRKIHHIKNKINYKKLSDNTAIFYNLLSIHFFSLANFRTPSVSKPLPKPKQEIPQRTAPKPPLPYSGNVASPTSPTSAVSSLPQVAVGGGGSDYDSPWEWKVNKVEQEFVKRFSVGGDSTKPAVAPRSGAAGGKRLGPAPPPPINNQNINPVPKPHRTNPPPPIPATLINRKEKEYQVDPTIPLDNQG